jgi:hypothetical protein
MRACRRVRESGERTVRGNEKAAAIERGYSLVVSGFSKQPTRAPGEKDPLLGRCVKRAGCVMLPIYER